MIKGVLKCPNNMVMVFNEKGEQIPKYQGHYEKVKESILKDAPPEATFGYLLHYDAELKAVLRKEW